MNRCRVLQPWAVGLLGLAASLGCPSGDTVEPTPTAVAHVTVAGPGGALASGATAQLTASVRGSDGSVLTGRTSTWSSSNSSVAAVDNTGLVTAGMIRGGVPGQVTITATVEGKSGSLPLTVSPVPVAAVELTPAAPMVRTGQSLTLTATLRDVMGEALNERAVGWSSLAPSVATVSSQGVVTGIAPGVSEIRATVEGVSGSVVVTVPPAPGLTLTVTNAPAYTLVGDTVTLDWLATDAASCEASGAWSGPRALSGTEARTLDSAGSLSFGLACGGPGGEVSRQVTVTARRPVSRQSYDNFKDNGVTPSVLPVFFGTTAYGDFFGTGTGALLTAELRYDPAKQTVEQSPPSLMEWWTMRPDRTWQRAALPVTVNAPWCVHPRKLLVTEVNGDRRPDILLMCHGYDGPPFPGERNLALLSQLDGSYRQRALSPDSAFFHGGATCDLDSDGSLELITANGQQLQVHAVMSDGSLQARPAHPVSSIGGGGLYSVECLDINEDGRTDIVFGGHEPGVQHFTTHTRIWFGQPGGSYQETVIPAVPNEGIVLDFTVTGTGSTRALWVLRTSGGDGTSYLGNTLQRVSVATMTSSIAFSSRNVVQLSWVVPYLRDGVLYLGAESSGPQPGPGGRIGWEYRVSP